MEHVHTSPEDDHDNAYSGLLVNDAHWAFGTDFEDPLAGVDTTIPDGTDAATLGAYALMLGDDALVMSHRISEWTSNAPDLEDDIALSNIALDLLGQARLLLARAARADESLVPVMPEGSPVPAEDALAFFREAHEFRNVRLTEVANGDFAEVTVRVLLFSIWRLAIWEQLRTSRDNVLAAVAAKGVEGAGLPPRLRRPLVRHAGRRHGRVPQPAARGVRRAVAAVARALRRPRDRGRRGRVRCGCGPLDRPRVGGGDARPGPRRSRCPASRGRPTLGRDGPLRPRRDAWRTVEPVAGRDAVRGPRSPAGPVVRSRR